MDFAAILQVVVRRWWILALGLLLTGAGAYVVYRQVPTSYQSTSQAIILLPPTASSPEFKTSPFLYLPNGLNVLARVTAIGPDTADFRASMMRDGFGAKYEVDVETQAPIVRFSVEGSDPSVVDTTHTELLRRFEMELERVQSEEGVPKRQTAHARFLDATSDPVAVGGDRFRAVVMTGGVGALVSLTLVFLLDRALRARSDPRRSREEEPGSGREDEIESPVVPSDNRHERSVADDLNVDTNPAVADSAEPGVVTSQERTTTSASGR